MTLPVFTRKKNFGWRKCSLIWWISTGAGLKLFNKASILSVSPINQKLTPLISLCHQKLWELKLVTSLSLLLLHTTCISSMKMRLTKTPLRELYRVPTSLLLLFLGLPNVDGLPMSNQTTIKKMIGVFLGLNFCSVLSCTRACTHLLKPAVRKPTRFFLIILLKRRCCFLPQLDQHQRLTTLFLRPFWPSEQSLRS